MMKKTRTRLLSLTTALMMALTPVAFMPDSVLKADAEGDHGEAFSKMNNKPVPYDNTAWENSKERQEYDYYDAEWYNGKIQLWLDKVEVDPADAANRTQKVELNVKGAQEKAADLKFHIYYDPRLTPTGYRCLPGDAMSEYTIDIKEDYEDNCIIFDADEDADVLKNGVVCTLLFTLPADAAEGDLYPIGLEYYSDENEHDMFQNAEHDDDGWLMNIYVFEKGIENGYISVGERKAAAETSLTIREPVQYDKFLSEPEKWADPMPSDVELSSIKWKKKAADNYCSPTDWFRAGIAYTGVFLFKDDGSINADTKVSINGRNAAYLADESISGQYVAFSADFDVGEPINEVNVTITEPKAGEKPDFKAVSDTDKASPYVITGAGKGRKSEPDKMEWSKNGDEVYYLEEDDTFEIGSTYKARVKLLLKDNYYIPDDAKVTIGGKEAVKEDFSVDNSWVYYTAEFEIKDPHEHTEGEVQTVVKKKPTCTADGESIEYIYCTECGEELSSKTVAIPALGHDWSNWYETKKATKDEKGEEERTCDICGATETREVEYKEDFLLGDVNSDGKITVTDLSKVAAHIKSVKMLTEDQQKRADVNTDSKITVTDLSKIAAHIKSVKTLS